MNLLGFTNGNAKLDKGISILSLPAGHSCPGANLCKSQLVKTLSNSNGYGIKDGPNCQFRCFAAINEVLFPSTRKQRWNNFELLRKCKSVKEMTDLIISSEVLFLPEKCSAIAK